MTEIIHQEDGHDVHVWTDSTGQRWACCAYDHGPMCRLCQHCDDFTNELLDAVRDGTMIVSAKPDGQFQFKVTAKGAARAEDLIGSDPEMAALWADLQRNKEGIADALGAEDAGERKVTLNPVEQQVLEALYEMTQDARAEAVEAGEDAEVSISVQAVVERTDLTAGQVEQALGVLSEVGFVG